MATNVVAITRGGIGVAAVVLILLVSGPAHSGFDGGPWQASHAGDIVGREASSVGPLGPLQASGKDPLSATLLPRPVTRNGHDISYDSESKRTVRFGDITANGGTRNDETWAYGMDANTRIPSTQPTARPAPRCCHDMAYNGKADRIILFGGIAGGSVSTATVYGDTWAYDFNTNTWTDVAPVASPPARTTHAMAYDSESDRVILFGGVERVGGAFVEVNDTWAYDFPTNTWTERIPLLSPSPRLGHRMVYDAQSDRIVLLGGHSVSARQAYNDTWTYDYNTNSWEHLPTATAPVAADHYGLAYDSGSDRVVYFGGITPSGGKSDETWDYDTDLTSWTQLAPTTKPSGRWLHAMAYDSASDRVVLFGGEATGVPRDDTWIYDLDGDVWTNLISAPHPSARVLHRMAYDSESDRTVLFGGLAYLEGPANDETWAYDVETNTWTPETLPSAPQSLGATSGDAIVTLSWDPPGSDGGVVITSYRIYRGVASGSLAFFAAVGNVLTYTDTSVTNGVTYYYAVSAVTSVGEGPSSEEIAATPAPPADSTNPSITITSPSDGATLASLTVRVTGNASDNVALSKVELSTDGSTPILASGTTSWSADLTLREGADTITARATDTSGNVATATVTVTVVPPTQSTEILPPFMLGVLGGGVILVAAVVAAYLSWRRRRGGA